MPYTDGRSLTQVRGMEPVQPVVSFKGHDDVQCPSIAPLAANPG